jgi:hypothetical protein
MARTMARPRVPAIERISDLIAVSPTLWRGLPPLRLWGSP